MAGDMPLSRLRFGTFTAADVPIEDLRQTAKAVSQSARKMLSSLPALAGTFTAFEASVNKMDGQFHPHIHVLMDTKAGYFGGRNGMNSSARWEEKWRQSLPVALQNMQSPVVKPVTDIPGLTCYVTKQRWFTGITDEQIADTVAQIQALHNLPRYRAVGSLAVN
jgi:Replication protein